MDPDARALTFTGTGSVAITVAATTKTITINAVDLSARDVKRDGRVPATVALDPAGKPRHLPSSPR